MSDFEASSQASKEEFDQDDFLELERAKRELEDKVNTLTKENNVLRAQFSSAVRITDQLKEAKQKSEVLSQNVRTLNSEKENLERRLQISNKSYEELSSKYDQLRENYVRQQQYDEDTQKNEMKKLRSQFQSQIERLQSDLDNSKEENNALEIEHKSLSAKTNRLIDSFSYYFQTEFNSIDDLCMYIEQQPQQMSQMQQSAAKSPNEKQNRSRQVYFSQNNDNEIHEYKSKIKSLKKQIRQITEEKEDAEQDKETMQSKISDLQSRLDNQERLNDDRISRLKETYEFKNKEQEHQITLLTNKVENLKSDLQRSRSSLRETTMVQIPNQNNLNTSLSQSPIKSFNSQQPQQTQGYFDQFGTGQKLNQSLTNPENSNRQSIDQLISKNQDLMKEIDALNQDRDKLINELRNVSDALKNAETENAKMKTDNTALQHVKDELIAETNTLRNALRNAPKKAEPSEKKKYKKELSYLKQKISKGEQALETQKKVLFDTQMEVEQKKQEVKEFSEKVKQYEDQIQHKNEEIKKITTEVHDLQRKLDSVKPPEDVPSAAFMVPDFDQELSQSIERIASNKMLQVSSRIQNVLRQTVSYYNNKLASAVKEADKAVSVVHSIRNSFGKFIVDLSIASTGSALTFDDFVTNNAGVTIVSSVSQLRSERDEFFRRADTLQGIVNSVAERIGCDPEPSSFSETLNAYLDQSEKQRNALAKRTKKLKDAKGILDNLQKKHLTYAKEASEKIENYLRENQKLSDELKIAREESAILRRNNQNINLEMRELRDSQETLQLQFQQEQTDQQDLLDKEISKLQQQHEEEVGYLNQQVQNLNTQLLQVQSERDQLKQVIASQTNQISDLQKQITTVKKEKDDFINNKDEQNVKEKEQIAASYENAMKDIKQQGEKMRADIEKLSSDIASANKKLKETKDALFNTKRDKYKLEAELKTKTEELEREKALAKSTREVDQIEAETKFNQKMNQKIQECEKEKRDMISLLANEFSDFAPSSAPIDDRLFRNIVAKLHTKLTRLTNSDSSIRRLVNASEGQPTEDAVAQILLNQ